MQNEINAKFDYQIVYIRSKFVKNFLENHIIVNYDMKFDNL